MSLKEYTELSPQKQKLWADFCWTLKDCQEAFKKGFGNLLGTEIVKQVKKAWQVAFETEEKW